MLLIDVLRSNVAARKFQLHDFVIMPDHLHLLMTLPGDTTIEKAMQLIKGGFSYRLKKEFGYQGEVWQRGFSEVRIMIGKAFSNIANICPEPRQSRARRYCRAVPLLLHIPGKEKSPGAKALIRRVFTARLKSCPNTKHQSSGYQKLAHPADLVG